MMEDSEIPNKKIPKIMKMSFHDILRSRGLPETFYKLNTIQGPSRGVNRLEYDFLYLGWLYLYYWLNISFSDLEFHQRDELQSLTKYLRQTLVFIWNCALRERFNLCFSGVLCLCWRNIHFWGGDRRWAIILWSFGNFLKILISKGRKS